MAELWWKGFTAGFAIGTGLGAAVIAVISWLVANRAQEERRDG